ncbi:ethanolamine utilization protein EutN [Caloramator sp. E03]|uniref:EutN/CcmL family microcompartment protein n=1 Tax=Caloramator sp. E03 TaxID=2576307 RepID=UPI001110BFA5|nr:EutN/CcmL family microcompartment protein [Caloramator sp. E03]QCX33961.1 ethanolamine utilization protein EutN [Caloramator sp. E03]
MIIAKVVGTVISTRKSCNLVGSKFLIVEPVEEMKLKNENRIVAVDTVGAGVGEIVLVALGSAARVGCNMAESPVDAAVVGIVDNRKDIVITE